MLRLLVAVDGSDDSLRAVRQVAEMRRRGLAVEAVVLHVQPPVLSGEVGVVAPIEGALARRRVESRAAIASAREILREADVRSATEIAAGDVPDEIARAARRHRCDTIVLGQRGLGRVAGALLGSVSSRVAHVADAPVMVVP